jgi:hypothetical protein
MNTVQRFDYLKTETFNGQDYLKKHFLSANPILYTTNLNDRSIPEKYAGLYNQVWLVSPEVQLNEDFPWWLRISTKDKNCEYEFPYVYKNSKNIKSWGLVKLVPTSGEITETIRKRNICGYYDILCGKEKFDMFFLGDKGTMLYEKLYSINPEVKLIKHVKEAFPLSTTDMFWIVPDNIKIADDFLFDTIPSERSQSYAQIFSHGTIDSYEGGIVLMPKNYDPSEKEIEHNFYIKRKVVKQIASYPA